MDKVKATMSLEEAVLRDVLRQAGATHDGTTPPPMDEESRRALHALQWLCHDFENHLLRHLYGPSDVGAVFAGAHLPLGLSLRTTSAAPEDGNESGDAAYAPQQPDAAGATTTTPVPAALVVARLRTRAAHQFGSSGLWGSLCRIVDDWARHAPRPSGAASPCARALHHLSRRLACLDLLVRHTHPAGPRGELSVQLTRQDISHANVPEASVIDEVSFLLRSEVLSFPWRRLSMSEERVSGMMARLRGVKLEDALRRDPCEPHNIRFSAAAPPGTDGKVCPLLPLRYRGGHVSFHHRPDDYDTMDALVDVFNEEARLAARRQDQPTSPLVRWRQGDVVRPSVAEALRRTGKLDAHTLREGFYQVNRKECTQFKPSLVVLVVRFFRATRVLDFSAGWGDRLAGAIAADVDRYTAFDPNPALIQGHADLIRKFGSGGDGDEVGGKGKGTGNVKAQGESSDNAASLAFPISPNAAAATSPTACPPRFSVTCVGFEDAVVESEAYDLVFTSPPFFDFEIYTDAPGQSVDTYTSLDAWLVKFLFASMRKAWSGLVPGGNCVIHIADVYKTRACEPMCLLALWLLPHAEYAGVICSVGDAGRPRPMWVFHKRSGGDDSAAAAAADGDKDKGAAQGEASGHDVLAKHAGAELKRLYPSTHAMAVDFVDRKRKRTDD
eukprot:m.17321 g.17321  ORF g.17321 m.17321 type:complete len:669 (+) comp5437_c0_seq1:2-2008(+)